MMLLPVPCSAAPDEMLTITPSPVARSSGTKARIVANGPRTFAVNTASIRSSSSASRSLCATILVKPAELTRMSARPKPSLTAAATLRICALSSIGRDIALLPLPGNSPVNAAARAAPLLLSMTHPAPAAAGSPTTPAAEAALANALKHEVRAGLVEGLRQARDDDAVEAVVIACAGRTFFAGADITEFGKPPQAPGLHDVIAAIEAMPKPVIAALHGTALGGGFELALACHFRVAVSGARVGLPEVKLGLLPGAGGTQRLPRLVGPEKALQMIVTGDPIRPAEARADGIIDEIVEGDLTAAAVDFARRVVREGRPLRRVRDRDEKLIGDGFADAAEALTRRLRGREAPAACVEAVRNAIVLPFDEGLRRESELFRQLVAGDQSKAQRHIFFGGREAAKAPGITDAAKGLRVVER